MACKMLVLAILSASLGLGRQAIEVLPADIAPPRGCTGPLLAHQPNDTARLVIPAFFPFPSDDEQSQSRELINGHYVLPAALLAMDEINEQVGLLPGFHLWLEIRDSSCDKYTGLNELILSDREAQSDPAPRLAVLGGGCSAVSSGLSLLARRLELPQVSYGNSPSSTDRAGNNLPFFQTVEAFSEMLSTTLLVLNYFEWTKNVALIFQGKEIYKSVLETVVRANLDGNFTASALDGNVSINLVIFHEVTDIQPSPGPFFDSVTDKNVRVIVAAVDEEYAYLLLCEAKNRPVPGSGFVWVFIGLFSDVWWGRNTTCTLNAEDVEYILVVSSSVRNLNQSAVLQTSGKSLSTFETEYRDRLQEWCPGAEGEPLASTTYDAVWAIALAVNSTLDLITHTDTSSGRQYNYSSTEVFNGISAVLSATNFVGASGRVEFNEVTRGRIGKDSIHQIQNGSQRLVGTYDRKLDFQVENFQVTWPDDDRPPSDEPDEIEESVPLWFIAPAVVVTLCGVAFSIAMFVFNWRYKRHKILLAASQRLNYIILAGTWLGFASVLILSLLESELGTELSDELFASLCVIRLAVLSMGFTLAYGTMFARAWRIYRIFNDPWVAKRPLRDYHLMLMVGLLIVGDLFILIPWSAVDTYRRSTSTSEIDYRSYSRCTYLTCGSTYLLIWLGITGMYKILLMLGGVFVVSLVRKGVVERKIFDDSKSLSLALYITAISFSVGLPLQFLFLLQFQVVFAFIVGAVWVNIAAWSTIVCVFLPKFYAIVIKKDSGKNLRSLKSVFYVAHPELKRRSPDTEFTDYRQSPDFTMNTSTSPVPITDSIDFSDGLVHALPSSVAKAVSFDDSVDFIS